MTPNALRLFAPNYYEPIDTTTQVTRLPPFDAPCPDDKGADCCFPFCRCFPKSDPLAANDPSAACLNCGHHVAIHADIGCEIPDCNCDAFIAS